jgi:hypothetical protein
MSRSRPAKPKPSTRSRTAATPKRAAEPVAPKRPPQPITLSPEATVLLEEMARENGMSISGVIEALIRRARPDPSPEVLRPGEAASTTPPPVSDRVPDPVPARKKSWGEAVREFREMRERMRK